MVEGQQATSVIPCVFLSFFHNKVLCLRQSNFRKKPRWYSLKTNATVTKRCRPMGPKRATSLVPVAFNSLLVLTQQSTALPLNNHWGKLCNYTCRAIPTAAVRCNIMQIVFGLSQALFVLLCFSWVSHKRCRFTARKALGKTVLMQLQNKLDSPKPLPANEPILGDERVAICVFLSLDCCTAEPLFLPPNNDSSKSVQKHP